MMMQLRHAHSISPSTFDTTSLNGMSPPTTPSSGVGSPPTLPSPSGSATSTTTKTSPAHNASRYRRGGSPFLEGGVLSTDTSVDSVVDNSDTKAGKASRQRKQRSRHHRIRTSSQARRRSQRGLDLDFHVELGEG